MFQYLKKNKYRGEERGFTLVEMIAAMSIFTLVMVTALGALLSVVDANRKAQALKLAINNLNFAVEKMSREIRSGSKYHCGGGGHPENPKDCGGNGKSEFAFESKNGNPAKSCDYIDFKLENSGINKDRIMIGKNTSSCTGNGTRVYTPFTTTLLKIETLSFNVEGSCPLSGASGCSAGNMRQPKVTIIIKGYAGNSQKTRSYFDIQTTIAQRLLDV